MKRALIVDDSRSARVILSRMLESYGLQVEACESAEQALEHLRHSRPDVIFMDHLMPGMDGFQAVQALKGDPATAMIPVVMYTSQEGELYVSQARALGAVGVLPKTVKQADVSRVLYQLRLLPERRESRPNTTGRTGLVAGESAVAIAAQLEAPAAMSSASAGQLEAVVRAAVAPLLKEQSLEMRRLMLASLEAYTRREARAAGAAGAATQASQLTSASGTASRPNPQSGTQASSAQTALTASEPSHVQEGAVRPEARESGFVQATLAGTNPRGRRVWLLAGALVALAILPTLVLAGLYLRSLEHARGSNQATARLASLLEQQQAQLTALHDRLLEPPLATASASITAQPISTSESVPYGEAPLAGPRVERLRELLSELRASGFRGKLKVSTYVGEFCLTGNGIEGYSLAPDEVPLKRCDLVGNPFDDSLTAAQRQSLAFANLLASARQDSGGLLTIEVQHEGRRPLVPYPGADQRAQLTAGEWNRIAAQNNRVEFAAQPAGS